VGLREPKHFVLLSRIWVWSWWRIIK
jgi:hypothetical protein